MLSKGIKYIEIGMKRVRVMTLAVLGIIVLLLSFAPMPAATTAPTGVAEAEAGSDMAIGTEVVLGNNTVATYLGKTLDGNYKWQATFEGPKYLDDLQTPIDCRWDYDIDKEEWNSCANLFNATVKDDRVTVEYQGVKMDWQPQLEIGNKQQTENGTTLLPVDPINENYPGNTLQWDYGNGITRNLRIIEGMLIEYYTISELPAGDVAIETNVNKDAGFVWTRPPSAWDNSTRHEPVNLIVDGDNLTLTLETMQNATLPITIDPDTTFTTSSSDGCLEVYPGNDYSVTHNLQEASREPADWQEYFVIGQYYDGDYYIGRSFVYFDTSSLPENIDITSATLRLRGCFDHSDQNFYIQIQSGMPDHPEAPMVKADYYYQHYSGNGGDMVTMDFDVGSYNDIVLSNEGESWIDTQGWTKLCLRSTRDINWGGEPDGREAVAAWAYEKAEGYRPELVVTYEILPPPLERYAPVLYFHPEEDYYTDPINSMLDESNLKNTENETFSLPNPTTDNLTDYNTSKYYMDMRNAEPGSGKIKSDGSWESTDAVPPDPSRFESYDFTVHGRQVEVDNYIVLQYWFFYPYNRWGNCHEGDWERIQIICDKATETPQRVTFGQHWGGETVPWASINNSLVAETHPRVFVGVGSHASYPTNGDNGVQTIVWWIVDYTSYAGKALYPGYVSVYEIPGVDKLPYTLTDISSGHSWVKWLGIWGFIKETRGQCGCPGPANLEVNGINIWDDPIEWANNPGSPWNILTATGPVRLHAYDSNGNHTGLNETGWIETEIPGTYFYVPASNQSDAELMWIYTEENLTFTIEATEVGESNFSFARCVGGEITTNYSHINVETEDTTAKVDTSEGNPLLLMELDFDSDGVTDEYKFPDSNSTLKGQVNFTGRDTPPNDRWIEPFVVKLFESGNLTNVLWTGVATTNNTGVFTIDDIPTGTYDIGIKNWTCLSELVTNVTVGVNETVEVDFGTTREGDSNGNDAVTAIDFSLLAGAFGSIPGDPNWNANCDFDRNDAVTAMDFSLLAGNFGTAGPLQGY